MIVPVRTETLSILLRAIRATPLDEIDRAELRSAVEEVAQIVQLSELERTSAMPILDPIRTRRHGMLGSRTK